jgi:hypothetical protein
MTERIAWKYCKTMSRTLSGSSRSPRAVDPDKSQKSIVASCRRSPTGCASDAPQLMQKRASRGFALPHTSQTITAQGYSPGPAFSLTLGAALRSTPIPHESARIAPPTCRRRVAAKVNRQAADSIEAMRPGLCRCFRR